MSSLYEIDFHIMECVDEETGEILDEAKLDELQMERDKKIENIALWIKNLRSDAEEIKREKLALADRQSKLEKKADSVENYLAKYLDGQKFQTAKCDISFRKSESLIVDDMTFIPFNYLKQKDPEVDKTALKKAIKAGEQIEGAHIEVNKNITIK